MKFIQLFRTPSIKSAVASAQKSNYKPTSNRSEIRKGAGTETHVKAHPGASITKNAETFKDQTIVQSGLDRASKSQQTLISDLKVAPPMSVKSKRKIALNGRAQTSIKAQPSEIVHANVRPGPEAITDNDHELSATARSVSSAPTISLATRFWVLLGLVGSMVGAFVISKLVLAQESLRLDESQSIWQTAHSLSGMLEIVAQDVHMPLYHIILHYWMIAFGTGVDTIRTLSLLFFLMTIPFVYLLARTIMNRRWAMFVTLLFSLNPFMNWYANEARMYTMLAFFSVVNQYFFVRILQKKKGWLGYGMSAVIGAYSHYFFIFNLLTQAIFFLTNKSKFKPGTLKRLAGVAALIGLAIAPWIAYFILQGAAGNTRPLIQPPTTVNFFNAYSQFLFGFQTDNINTIIVSCWPLLVIVAFFTVKRHLKVDVATSYLLVAASVPVLLAFCLSFVVTPFFLSRYMVPVVAPLLIIIAWLLSRYSRTAVLTVAALWLGIVGVAFTQQVVNVGNPVRENYAQAADYIGEKASPSDIVVLSAPFTVYPFEYYYDGSAQIRTLPIWDRQNVGPVPAFDAAKLPEQANQLIRGHQYIYLLLSHDQGYSDDIYQYFNNRFERTYTKVYSDDLTLYVYRVGYSELPKIRTLRE